MKKYNTIISEFIEAYSIEIEYDIFVCELNASDMDNAEKEFSIYMKKSGEIYERDPNKEPSVKNFFKLFFGEEEDCDVYGEYYTVPSRYICSNGNVAERFYRLAKQLVYHDRYNQEYCDVTRNENVIDILYGDY